MNAPASVCLAEQVSSDSQTTVPIIVRYCSCASIS